MSIFGVNCNCWVIVNCKYKVYSLTELFQMESNESGTSVLSHRHRLTLHIFPACLVLMAVGWSIGIMLVSPPSRCTPHPTSRAFHVIYRVLDDQARFQSEGQLSTSTLPVCLTLMLCYVADDLDGAMWCNFTYCWYWLSGPVASHLSLPVKLIRFNTQLQPRSPGL